MLWSPLHACPREAGEVWRTSAVFCNSTTNRYKETGRKFCLQVIEFNFSKTTLKPYLQEKDSLPSFETFLIDYNFVLVFRLELNGHRRRLTWEATPRSIHEGVSSAILNSDCLVFDTSIAQLFADNGNLGINVTISMCWACGPGAMRWRRRAVTSKFYFIYLIEFVCNSQPSIDLHGVHTWNKLVSS